MVAAFLAAPMLLPRGMRGPRAILPRQACRMAADGGRTERIAKLDAALQELFVSAGKMSRRRARGTFVQKSPDARRGGGLGLSP